MGPQSTALRYATLQSINSSTFTGSYQALGSPTTVPARIFKIVNGSSVAVTVSIDATNDHDYLPSDSYVLYDAGTNRGNPSPSLDLPENTQFYVKGTAGTGSVYLVVLYAVGSIQTAPL